MQDLAPNLAEVKMSSLNTQYALLLEINKLKLVFRNTAISTLRKESTAEHSWSVSMIILILMQELKKEFTELDELKLKMQIIQCESAQLRTTNKSQAVELLAMQSLFETLHASNTELMQNNLSIIAEKDEHLVAATTDLAQKQQHKSRHRWLSSSMCRRCRSAPLL